jgi:hypothetical protein
MQSTRSSLVALILALYFMFQPVSSYAHGEGPWNDFMIDSKNRQVELTLEEVKKLVGDIALERRMITAWPDTGLRSMRINITALQEEVDGMLNHMKEEDGIYLQLPSTLRDIPQAGRSVTGSYALEIALELIDHIAEMESLQAFQDDLEEDGITAYMFDLMDTYLDKMVVYGYFQQTKQQLGYMETAFQSRTAMQDLKYHLRKLLLEWGFDGLAASLIDNQETEQNTSSADTSTSLYGGALPAE